MVKSQTELQTAKVKDVLHVVVFYGTAFCSVIVYEVKIDNKDLHFNNFYIASFYDDMDVEKVWGAGKTVNDALRSAEINWGSVIGDDPYDERYSNPFREALSKLEENDPIGLSGEVVMKKVFKDGDVIVYKVENPYSGKNPLSDDIHPRFKNFYTAINGKDAVEILRNLST